MLKSGLQSQCWPRRSPARLVREAALLFKAMPRRLRSRAAKKVTTRTERHDPLRVALSCSRLRNHNRSSLDAAHLFQCQRRPSSCNLKSRESYAGDPNRFHAACRETASACPIVAQLTSRSRRMSAISCIPASILSNAPLYPARVFNKVSVGAFSGKSEFATSRVAGFRFLFWMTCRQSSTHSSQMNTPGPATRVLTSVCAFPQKEQRYARFEVWVMLLCGMTAPFRQRKDDSQSFLDANVNLMLTAPEMIFWNENCRCRCDSEGSCRLGASS
jgi:hypothetical protein